MRKYILLTIFSLIIGETSLSFGQVAQTLDVGAAVNARAKLTLGSTTINFPDADPDTVPSIAAPENPVSVTASFRSNSAVELTVLATSDLTSGSSTIPISNVTWTHSGRGFKNGTMSTSAQLAGTWIGSDTCNGTFRYFLANSWSYATGNYTATVIYTLTAP